MNSTNFVKQHLINTKLKNGRLAIHNILYTMRARLEGTYYFVTHTGCFHSDVSGVGGRHLATFEVNTVVADWDLNAHGTTSAQLRRNSGALRTQTSAVQPSRATHWLGFGFGFG